MRLIFHLPRRLRRLAGLLTVAATLAPIVTLCVGCIVDDGSAPTSASNRGYQTTPGVPPSASHSSSGSGPVSATAPPTGNRGDGSAAAANATQEKDLNDLIREAERARAERMAFRADPKTLEGIAERLLKLPERPWSSGEEFLSLVTNCVASVKQNLDDQLRAHGPRRVNGKEVHRIADGEGIWVMAGLVAKMRLFAFKTPPNEEDLTSAAGLFGASVPKEDVTVAKLMDGFADAMLLFVLADPAQKKDFEAKVEKMQDVIYRKACLPKIQDVLAKTGAAAALHRKSIATVAENIAPLFYGVEWQIGEFVRRSKGGGAFDAPQRFSQLEATRSQQSFIERNQPTKYKLVEEVSKNLVERLRPDDYNAVLFMAAAFANPKGYGMTRFEPVIPAREDWTIAQYDSQDEARLAEWAKVDPVAFYIHMDRDGLNVAPHSTSNPKRPKGGW